MGTWVSLRLNLILLGSTRPWFKRVSSNRILGVATPRLVTAVAEARRAWISPRAGTKVGGVGGVAFNPSNFLLSKEEG